MSRLPGPGWSIFADHPWSIINDHPSRSATALHGDSGSLLRFSMPAPRGIPLALDDRMDARHDRGQPEDGEAYRPRGARGGGTFGAKSKSLDRIVQTPFGPGLRTQAAPEAVTHMTKRVLLFSSTDRRGSNLRFWICRMQHQDGRRGSRSYRAPALSVDRATEAATLVRRGRWQ
jgi:hypothetical protein